MKVHPKRSKWINQRLLWLGGGLLVLLMIGAAIRYKKSREVMTVNVKILDDKSVQFLGEREVKSYLFKEMGEHLEGKQGGDIDLRYVEQVLEKNPFIKEADVYIDALGNLDVRVRQRNPIIRVMQQDGSSYYLDAKGTFMPASQRFAARVPVVTGFTGKYDENWPNVKGHLIGGLYDLATRILNDDFLRPQVEQIHVESDGDVLLVPALGDFTINLGNLEELDSKLKRLRGFFDKVIPHEGWNAYKLVSVKYKGQIVGVRN